MKKLLFTVLVLSFFASCNNDNYYDEDPEFPSIMFDEPILEKYGRSWQSKDSVMIDNVNYKMYFNINYTFAVNSSNKETDRPGSLIRTREKYVSSSETKQYECLYKYNYTHLKVNSVKKMIISEKDTSYIGVAAHPMFSFVRDTIEGKIYTRQKPTYELFPDSLIINNTVLLN